MRRLLPSHPVGRAFALFCLTPTIAAVVTCGGDPSPTDDADGLDDATREVYLPDLPPPFDVTYEEGRVTAIVGGEGAALELDETRLLIPAGALSEPTEITIELADDVTVPADEPAPMTPVFRFTPHGLAFDAPVTVLFEAPGSLDDPTQRWRVMWTDGDSTDFADLGGVVVDGWVAAQVEHFSLGFATVAPGDPDGPDGGIIDGDTLQPDGNVDSNCTFVPGLPFFDLDDDGFGDGCDTCPGVPNAGDEQASDADGDGVPDVCDREDVTLTGSWPQASVRRFAPFAQQDVARAYRMRTGYSGDQYWEPEPCGSPDPGEPATCNTSCGLRYKLAQSAPSDVVSVSAIGDGASAHVAMVERKDSRFRTLVHRFGVGDGLTPTTHFELEAALLTPHLPWPDGSTVDNRGVIVTDLMRLGDDLAVVARVRYAIGEAVYDHPAVFGLAPDSGEIRWSVALPFGDHVAALSRTEFGDAGQGLRAFVRPGGRLLLVHTSQRYDRVADTRLYESPIPAAGKHAIATRAPDEVQGAVRDLLVDDRDRVWLVRVFDDVPAPQCETVRFERYRLEVYDPAWSELANTLIDVAIATNPRKPFNEFARTPYDNTLTDVERDGQLLVERLTTPDGDSAYRAVIFGEPPETPADHCDPDVVNYGKSPTSIDFDNTNPNGCPATVFAGYCCDSHAATPGAELLCEGQPDQGECPCKDCSGMLINAGCDTYSNTSTRYAFQILQFDDRLQEQDRQLVPIEESFFWGARRQGQQYRHNSPLALSGTGQLLLGTFECVDSGGLAQICGRLDLYDLSLDNDTGGLLVDPLVMRARSMDDPGLVVGASGRFFATMGFGSDVGVAGPDAQRAQILSRSPTWHRATPREFIGQAVVPIAPGKLLTFYDIYDRDAAGQALRTTIVRLFTADEELVVDGAAQALEAPLPEVDGCDPIESCSRVALPTTVASEMIWEPGELSEQPFYTPEDGWAECQTAELRPDGSLRAIPCDRDELITQWEESQAEAGHTLTKQVFSESGRDIGAFALVERLTSEGRGIFVTCDRSSVVTETQGPPEAVVPSLRLRCDRWTEHYVPGRMLDVLGGIGFIPRQRERYDEVTPLPLLECPDLGRPSRETLIRVNGQPLDVAVTNQTAPDEAFLPNHVARLCPASGGPVEYVIVAGNATFTLPDGSTATTTPSGSIIVAGDGCVLVTSDSPGTVVVEVFPREDDHPYRGESTSVGIVFLPPEQCKADPEDNSYEPCVAPHPMPLVDASQQSSRLSPAEAARGVMLHDMSYRADAIDLEVKSIGMDLTLGRHYQSSREPTQGGYLGGWTMHFDQRLVPIVDAGAAGSVADLDPSLVLEDLDGVSGHDLAFHDGRGRVDTWRHPGASDVTQTTLHTVFDHASSRVEIVPLGGPLGRAVVVEYEAPPGRFDRLLGYTLVYDDQSSALTGHPYATAGGKEIGNLEARFYEMISPDGTRRIFNCKGQLLRIIDPRYHEIELVYGGPHHPVTQVRQLSEIIDPNGRVYKVSWQAFGPTGARWPRISRIEDPFGRTISYDYRVFGGKTRLTEVRRSFRIPTDPDAAPVSDLTRYDYDPAGRLTSITLPGDARPALRNTYDAAGRVIQQVSGRGSPSSGELAVGGTWTLVKSSDTAVSVTDPRGHVTRYTLQQLPGSGPFVVRSMSRDVTIWDGSVNPIGSRSSALVTTYTYLADGLLQKTDYPGNVSEAFVYDEAGYLTKKTRTATAVPAKVWEWSYDPTCHLVTREKHPGGKVVTRFVAQGDEGAPGRRCRVLATEHSPVTGGDGIARTWSTLDTWIEAGPLRGQHQRRVTTANPSIDGQRREATFEYHATEDDGGASPADYRNGKITRYRLGHPKTITLSGLDADVCEHATISEQVTHLETDLRGNVTRLTRSSAAGPIVTTTTYDAKDRPTAVVSDPDGANNRTTTTYDARDRVTRTTQDRKDNFSILEQEIAGDAFGDTITLIGSSSAAAETFESYYDIEGRLYAELHGAGAGADRDFVIHGHDARGLRIRRAVPGSGISAAQLDQVFAAVRGGTPAPDLFAQLPKNDAATHAERGPAVIIEATRYDERQLMVAATIEDGADPAAAEPDGIQPTSRTQRYHRDLRGNIAVHETGRAGHYVLSTFDGHDNVLSETTVDPNGCAGAATPLRKVEYSGYDLYDHASLMRVFGDDGDVGLEPGELAPTTCLTNRKLQEQSWVYDQWGRVREASVERFAVHPANRLTASVEPETDTTRYVRDLDNQVLLQVNGDHETQRGQGFDGQVCAQLERLAPRLETVVPIVTQRWTRDGAGLVVAFEEVHGGGPDAIVAERTTTTRDRLGRVVAETDGVGQVQRMVYDATSRVRGRVDRRGVLHEMRYDGIGNVVVDVARASGRGETRGRRYTWAGPWLVEQESFVVPGERASYSDDGVVAIHHTESYAYDGFGLPALTWPHGKALAPALRERRVHDAEGNVASWTRLNGTTLEYRYDGLGNATRITTTAPWTEADRPQAYDRVPTTAEKRFRYNGVGQMTAAVGLAGQTLESTVLRFWDSAGSLLEEETTAHALPAAARTLRTRASYDRRGNRTRLAFAGAPANDWNVSYAYDDARRMTEARALHRTPDVFNNLERHRFAWTGRFPTRREALALSSSAPFVTTRDFNELGALYRVDNGETEKAGIDSRVWFKGEDPFYVVTRAYTLQGGIAGDPAILDALATGATKSHLPAGFDLRQGFTIDNGYATFANMPVASSFTATEHDGFGMATRTHTTTFSAQSGKNQHSFTWTTYDGMRQTSFQSLIWNPNPGLGYNAVEVKHTELTYANEPAAATLCAESERGPQNRVCRKRHTLLKESQDVNDLSSFPLVPTPTGFHAGGAFGMSSQFTAQGGDINTWHVFHTDSDKPLLASTPDLQGRPDRFENDYDLFDRLTVVHDRIERGSCGTAACYATERTVTFDALDRPLFEDFDFPSALRDEQPRRLVYFGQDRVEERHFSYAYIPQNGQSIPAVRGALSAAGVSFYLHGPAHEILWVDHSYIPVDLMPIEDVTGRFAGVWNAFDLTVHGVGSDILFTSNKPRPYAALGAGEVDTSYSFRWTSSTVESHPFDLTDYTPGRGWFRDLREDHTNNGWESNAALQTEISENRRAYDVIALALAAPVFVLPVGWVAEGFAVLADLALFAEKVARGDWSLWDAVGIAIGIGGVYMQMLDSASTAIHVSRPLERTRLFRQRAMARFAERRVNKVFDDLLQDIGGEELLRASAESPSPWVPFASHPPDPPPLKAIDPAALQDKLVDIEIALLEKAEKRLAEHLFDPWGMKHRAGDIVDVRYKIHRHHANPESIAEAMLIEAPTAAEAKMNLIMAERANLIAWKIQRQELQGTLRMAAQRTPDEVIAKAAQVAEDLNETRRGVAPARSGLLTEEQALAQNLDQTVVGKLDDTIKEARVPMASPPTDNPWAAVQELDQTIRESPASHVPALNAPTDTIREAIQGVMP